MAPVVVATARESGEGEKRHCPRRGSGKRRSRVERRDAPAWQRLHRAALRTHGISPGVGHRETLREGRASRATSRARVDAPETSVYRTTTTPRKNAAVFSRGDSRHENGRFCGKTRIEKTRGPNAFGSPHRGLLRSMTPLDRRDARRDHSRNDSASTSRRRFIDDRGFLAPRNTTRDRHDDFNENGAPRAFFDVSRCVTSRRKGFP